jgi:hypothetical protein
MPLSLSNDCRVLPLLPFGRVGGNCLPEELEGKVDGVYVQCRIGASPSGVTMKLFSGASSSSTDWICNAREFQNRTC